MLSVKYVVKIVNPAKEYFHITNDVKNASTLDVVLNNSGLTIKGEYFKNGVYLKASSQMPVGTDFSVNNNEDLVIQDWSASPLDVEEVFNINGKHSYEIDPKILSSMNVLTYESEVLYKMNHVIERREDVIFFKIDSAGKFSLMAGAVFNGPSHLVHLHFPIDHQTETYVYFIVGKTLKVGKGNSLHIPLKDVSKLPEGFCTLKNRLSTRTNIKFLSTASGGAIIHSQSPVNIHSTYPMSVDGVETTYYNASAREYVTVTPTDSLLSLDNLSDYSNNLTMIYKLDEDGRLSPKLCLAADNVLSLLDQHNIVYNNPTNKSLALLEADNEFKKAYVFVQYLLNIYVDDKVYQLENRNVLLNLLNNIEQFSNKIVKI